MLEGLCSLSPFCNTGTSLWLIGSDLFQTLLGVETCPELWQIAVLPSVRIGWGYVHVGRIAGILLECGVSVSNCLGHTMAWICPRIRP